MPELKTKPTQASVAEYLAAIDDPVRRADCDAIHALMRRLTKQEPRMWGANIVGFGTYRYQYASGHGGDWCQVGFSSRKGDISVYLISPGHRQDELLAKLGKHKMGKSCLGLRRLGDVDLKILERLIADSFAENQRRHGSAAKLD